MEDMPLNRRTFFLVSVLGLIALILVLSAIFLRNRTGKILPQDTQVISSVSKTVELGFSPEGLSVKKFASSSGSTALIMLNANSNYISGVQFELLFDPRAFLSFEVVPATDSIMGKIDRDYSVILNEVNLNNGSASFQAGIIPANISPRNGEGAVASVKFRINPQFSGDSTPVTFIKQKTLVTQKNVKESVLSEIKPLIINVE